MNQANQESKETILKTLAVIGFVAAIIFAVWLAVQIVGIIPGAFSSLASIADGVYNNRPQSTITVAAGDSVVNANESTTISWTELNRAGKYTFSYQCADGVALDVRTEDGTIVKLDCETPLNLSSDTLSVDVQAASEQRRFVDVDYTIGFTPDGQTEMWASETATFTVVNASIPQSVIAVAIDDEQDGEVAGESTTGGEEPETSVDPEPETPVTGGNLPTVSEEFVFEVPTSDPNGFADLDIRFLAVGTMDNDNDFTPSATIDNDTRGAFQFEVRNIGTKTSDEWEFEATLTSGTTFDSNDQAPLKPNERSIITLGFDAVGDTGTNFFGVALDGGNDINPNNDSFRWAVTVTN